MTERILVTGPFGQIGTDLVPELQRLHGTDNVIALRHHSMPDDFDGVVDRGDVRNKDQINAIIDGYNITQIYHLASILSARGEDDPALAWDVNMNGLKIILDLAAKKGLKLFWASSIAVFGPTTPREETPQHTVLEPTTIYGVTKLAGELLCQYYHLKYGVDVRSLRYPGLISYKAKPGGGTTDYAVDIFYHAVRDEPFSCFVREDTKLPMMYMPDAIKGTIQLMEAPADAITVRTSYNHAALSFSAGELAAAIKRHKPDLEVRYDPDERQKIADSWPKSIDDAQAREDWGWEPDYDLAQMTAEMLEKLPERLDRAGPRPPDA